MHSNWENSSRNGYTTAMTNPFDQQRESWLNPESVQIKTEPPAYNNFLRTTPPHQTTQEMTPSMFQQNTLDLLEQLPSFRHMNSFNPLTPPGYSGLLFSPLFHNQQSSNKQITPSKAQDLSKSKSHDSQSDSITPPIDVTPPKSPTTMDQTPVKSEENYNLEVHSESVESYDEESDEEGEDGSHSASEKIKKRKSNNKPRQYKCKQCKEIFFSKNVFWEHCKTHIKPEKMLQCPKCTFVTEYKHHLEYHLRNHSRVKPFQCPHCNYSCVNKSMLNSHLKSHSTVLQYRCLDCNYATKYCHSLKLHLRKYSHKPDIVLNLDGTPNPLPIIDVYGTRRGPKSKGTTSKLLAEIEKNRAQQNVQKSQLSPPPTPSTNSIPTLTSTSITNTPPSSLALPNAAMMVNMLQNKMHLFPYFNLNLQMLAAHQKHLQQQEAENMAITDDIEADTNFVENSPEKKVRGKRKGKAYKFEEKMNRFDDDLEDASVSEVMTDISTSRVSSSVNPPDVCEIVAEKTDDYECKFCGIVFKDNVLFSLHIGYHSLGDDPFRCNMCGMKTDDKVQFFLHIAKFPHS